MGSDKKPDLLEVERGQRQQVERSNTVLFVIVILLVAITAAGSLWLGRLTSQRDTEASKASENGRAAQDLATRVHTVCASSGEQSKALHEAGLCGAASSVSARVSAGPAGPAGRDSVSVISLSCEGGHLVVHLSSGDDRVVSGADVCAHDAAPTVAPTSSSSEG